MVWAVDDGYVGAIDPTTGTYTGDSHPRVILYWQERLDGRLCLFDEYYAIELQDDAQLAAGLARPYPAPEYAVVDKSAASLKGGCYLASTKERCAECRRKRQNDAPRSGRTRTATDALCTRAAGTSDRRC